MLAQWSAACLPEDCRRPTPTHYRREVSVGGAHPTVHTEFSSGNGSELQSLLLDLKWMAFAAAQAESHTLSHFLETPSPPCHICIQPICEPCVAPTSEMNKIHIYITTVSLTNLNIRVIKIKQISSSKSNILHRAILRYLKSLCSRSIQRDHP